MDWKLTGNSPVYRQLMDHMRWAVLAGDFRPGERIPSVRELAVQARVNPNTMQRAMSELEREEVLVNCGTTGRCVTENAAVLQSLRRKAVEELLADCARKCGELGLPLSEAAELLRSMEEEKEV